MALARAFRKSLLAILMLVLLTAPAWSQATARNPPPAPSHVELEAKPPDEPSSSSSPEVDIVPDATPSTGAIPAPSGSDSDSDAPVAANTIAQPPEIVTYVVPVYPPKARAQKIAGRVLLMVIVDESGKVEDNVEILDSIPMLDQAAVDAVHQWSFTPGRNFDGDPVRVRMEVPVVFTLR